MARRLRPPRVIPFAFLLFAFLSESWDLKVSVTGRLKTERTECCSRAVAAHRSGQDRLSCSHEHALGPRWR